jgi:phosphate transport system substrate-binding protein
VRTARHGLVAAALVASLTLAACGDDTGSGSELSGQIRGDGSSTVFLIMEAMAEEFGKEHSNVKVEVGTSGTGGGFEKFCNGETDFSDASRPIKDKEKQACAAKGIAFTEFRVAFDGLSVVANKDLPIDCLTVDELKKLWIAGSAVTTYDKLKAGLPATPVTLFGPGADSGTYDYFLEEILGTEAKFRDDFTASENDNTLVQGIERTPGSLGYFGFAYYEQNKDALNLVAVDGGTGCVKPSTDTIRDGSYDPLSRPLFVYVRNDRLARPEVEEFVRFVLTDGRTLVSEVGYVELADADYRTELAKLPA